jgi:hypothetical protein
MSVDTGSVHLSESDLPEVRKMRNEGMSWRDIGLRYGVSGQWVHQVFAKDCSDIVIESKVIRSDVEPDVVAYLQEHGPVTRLYVCEKFNVSPTQLSRMATVPKHLLLTDRSHVVNERFTDDQTYACIREAAHDMGEPLTANKYLLWHKSHPEAISLAGIHLRSSWIKACKAAGVTPGGSRRKNYRHKWSEVQMLTAVADFVEECAAIGIRPTYAAYERIQRTKPEWPSGSTLRIQSKLRWSELIDKSAGF